MLLSLRRGGTSLPARLRDGLSALLPLCGLAVALTALLVAAVIVPYLLVLPLPRSALAGLFLYPTLDARVQLGYWLAVAAGATWVVLTYGLSVPAMARRRGGLLAALGDGARLARGRRWDLLALLAPPVAAGWLIHRLGQQLAADQLAARVRRFVVPAPPVATGWLALIHRIDQVLVARCVLLLFVAATLAALYHRLAEPGEATVEDRGEPVGSPARAIWGAALLLGLPVALAYAATFPRPPRTWADAPPLAVERPPTREADREPPAPAAAPQTAAASREATGEAVVPTIWATPEPVVTTLELQAKGFSTIDEPREREKRAARNLDRCLDAYARAKGAGFPVSLSALGPAGTRCAPVELAETRDPSLTILYQPSPPDPHGQIRAYTLDIVTNYSFHSTTMWHLGSDETSLLYFNRDRNATESLDTPILDVEWLDSQLRGYLRSHPDRGYPASLDELEEARHPNLREIQIGLQWGRLDGYRYIYTPAPRDAQGRIPSFRLDVRPVRYGPPTTGSLLCDPRGELRTTPEDRPAEHTDRNMEEGIAHYCLGEKPLKK